MEENVLKSVKIKLGKKIKLLWAVVAVILVIVTVISLISFSGYKKAQKVAVDCMLLVTDEFNKYQNDYNKMVEKMYDFLNPSSINVVVNGIRINNSESVKAASEADRDLGDLMTELGYKCYRGSKYLEYVGYIDYTKHNSMTGFYISGSLILILLVINLVYLADQKKELVIDNDIIICKDGKKKVKQFMVKDIKSVSSAGIKGLKVLGNGIKYQINLVQNSEEIKSTIMDQLAALPSESANVTVQDAPISNADELKKYKELLDMGVISQEEFEAKKKQLLGL